MPSIVKLYKEDLPALKLVGRVYRDADRGANGTFSDKWAQWFANGLFGVVEDAGTPHTDSYVGAMRMNPAAPAGQEFEYWIGMLMCDVKAVPEGFECLDIAPFTAGVAWVKGKDGPALYAMCDDCIKAFGGEGWRVAENAWFIERYACPRFTQPDENGDIILDFMAALARE